jgi:branched-chain amino acid transport system substrate-binding protein
LLPKLGSAATPAPTKVRVAVVTAQTGTLARPSLAMIRALQMTAAQINQGGGLTLGHHQVLLDVQFVDAHSDPQSAAAQFRTLAKDPSVVAVIGPYDSDSVRALQTEAQKLHLPMVNASGASVDETPTQQRWMFSIGLSAKGYFAPVLQAAMRSQAPGRPVRVALLYQDDHFGNGIRDGVVAQAQNFAIPLVFQHPLSRQQDLPKVIDLLEQVRPTVLLVSANDVSFSRDLLRLLAQRRINLDMLVVSGCQAANLISLGEIAEYTLCPVQWDGLAEQEDPYWGSSAAFLTAYDVAFGEEPPYQAAQAATALVVLAQAIEAVGQPDREKVRLALEQTDLSTLFGPVRFGSNGRNIAVQALLEQVRGGSYITVLPPERAWVPLVSTMPPWEDRLP